MEAALWDLVENARWFGGRGREPRLLGVRPLEPVADVRSLLVDVGYADGQQETYHVPVVESERPALVEAVDDGLKLWEAFTAGSPDLVLLGTGPAPTAARRFAGEQSNTNVFFDNGTLLKVLRRVEPGGDIEAEVLGALKGSGAAPELYGTWKHGDVGLGILVEALANPHDGYDMAVEHASADRSFAEHAHALGVGLATVHQRLRESLGTGTTDPTRLAATFTSRYAAAAASVEQLRPFGDRTERTFGALAGVTVPTQRIHGDCHLGQTLFSAGRWRYVDFEGEPMKTVPERRELDSPLRDVAGMLRSFEYAAEAGAADADWLAGARRAFTAGYGLEEPTRDPLLTAYELDKAIYEAVYEARFRPHLLDVPLSGIDALLGSAG